MKTHLARWRTFWKERRIKRFLSLYDLPDEGSILDVSCGNGDFLSVLGSYFPKLDLHGVDMNENAIARAQEKFPSYSFSVGRVETLPYPDAKFIAVVSAMSFHHYAEPGKALEEMRRVLQPGGTLYLQDLVPGNQVSQFFWNFEGCPEPYHFERYYRREELESLAATAGLSLRDTRRMEWLLGTTLLVFQRKE